MTAAAVSVLFPIIPWPRSKISSALCTRSFIFTLTWCDFIHHLALTLDLTHGLHRPLSPLFHLPRAPHPPACSLATCSVSPKAGLYAHQLVAAASSSLFLSIASVQSVSQSFELCRARMAATEDQGYKIILATAFGFAIATVAVLLRLASRWLCRKRLEANDYFILAAYVREPHTPSKFLSQPSLMRISRSPSSASILLPFCVSPESKPSRLRHQRHCRR